MGKLLIECVKNIESDKGKDDDGDSVSDSLRSGSEGLDKFEDSKSGSRLLDKNSTKD